jgi:3-methyladenine DNA glycosylase AlkD
MSLMQIKTILKQISQEIPNNTKQFFKTGPDQYAAHDQFNGVSTPNLRKLVAEFKDLTFEEVQLLLDSPVNEERLLALFFLIDRYQNGTHQEKETVYQFYLHNLKRINNWNLVDASAHLILGAHTFTEDHTDILFTLAQSDVMWERRIAIVATWCFIQQEQCGLTYAIATILLNDKHDLIHKAVGWMLREAGKRNTTLLTQFLDQYATAMPRTMLRYAIEKFPETKRKYYLGLKQQQTRLCIIG